MPTDQEKRVMAKISTVLAGRYREALRLYEPMGRQAEFHQSQAKIRLLTGSNSGGKTLAGAVEMARALCRQDPHRKYPDVGKAICVGLDQSYLGEVFWKYLFRPGTFKVIRDMNTKGRVKSWRPWRPWDPADQARADQARPAEPLIPKRFIKPGGISWNRASAEIPERVTLTTGWEVLFRSSVSKPVLSISLHLGWFDEEISEQFDWYEEMQARLLRTGGLLYWSATAQRATEQLYRLHERYVQGDRNVEEFHVALSDNKYIAEENKEFFAANLSSASHAVRVRGDYALESFRVFPEFSMDYHGIDSFQVPRDWTRFMIVDPGRICAVVFVAVPPPDTPWGDMVLVYDECYLKECTANLFGSSVQAKATGQAFEAFLIDGHTARVPDYAFGVTLQEHYRDELAKRGVGSASTGSDFIHGSDDPEGSLESLRALMRRRDGQPPRFRIMRETCPKTRWEIENYFFKPEAGSGGSRPSIKPRDKHDHAIWCLKAIAAWNPGWVQPREAPVKETGAYAAFMSKMRRRGGDRGYVNLGPSTSLSY